MHTSTTHTLHSHTHNSHTCTVRVHTTLTFCFVYYRGERKSAASNGVQAVNKLLSVYGDDQELTPAVQELCSTIDAYIFVIDSGRASHCTLLMCLCILCVPHAFLP